MEQDLLENQPKADPPRAELEAMSKKIDEIYKLTNKTWKLFFWTMVGTVVMFVLPLIALAFVIPYFLRNVTAGLNGL